MLGLFPPYASARQIRSTFYTSRLDQETSFASKIRFNMQSGTVGRETHHHGRGLKWKLLPPHPPFSLGLGAACHGIFGDGGGGVGFNWDAFSFGKL